MVKVQVLLTTYNGQKYLPSLIESLKNQDYSDFSVLCQDDGSNDATADILSDICSSDLRFAMGQEQGRHLGAKGNFFSLIKQSDADYIALCDQDDVWHKDRLSCCIEALANMEKNWGTDTPLLVHSDSALCDEAGNIINGSFFANQQWDINGVSLQKLLVQNNATGCTMMFNKALKQIVCKTADSDSIFMHDWWIALTAASFGHVEIIKKPLVNYRQHSDNVLGASKSGIIHRCMNAAVHFTKAKERILLTYRQSEEFLHQFGDKMPEDSKSIVQTYVSTGKMAKLRRIITVRRTGCTMQSRVMRIGQMIFG